MVKLGFAAFFLFSSVFFLLAPQGHSQECADSPDLVITKREATTQTKKVRNKFTEALERYESQIKTDPSDPCSYCSAAYQCWELGEWQKARSMYQKSTLLMPVHPNHFANLAILENQMGLSAEAREHASKALEISQSNLNGNANDSDALDNKILSLIVLDRLAEATASARQLTQPYDSWAYFCVALLHKATGNKQAALESFNKELALNESNKDRYERGKLLIELGKKSEGEKDIAVALEGGYVPPPRKKKP